MHITTSMKIHENTSYGDCTIIRNLVLERGVIYPMITCCLIHMKQQPGWTCEKWQTYTLRSYNDFSGMPGKMKVKSIVSN